MQQQQVPLYRPLHQPTLTSSLHVTRGSRPSMHQQTHSPFKHPNQHPRQVVQQQKTQVILNQEKKEESQSQTDRLSLLHSRLQQEAEKIRKWKNVTELELRQKNHQLQEAQQLIEKQQKSLIDIQLQNESLNSRLEEEIANQQEIQRKIQSTRELCHALKEHTCSVETSVDQGENDRRELGERNVHLTEQYKELVEQFHQMEQQQIQTYDLLKGKIEQEKARKAELSKQLNELSTSSTEQIQTLQFELVQLRTENDKLTISLEEKSSCLAILEENKRKLEETLKEMEIIVSNKDAELESCNTQLNQRETEVVTLHSQLEDLDQEMKQLKWICSDHKQQHVELVKQHEDREREHQDLRGLLEAQLEEKERRLNQLDSQLSGTIEEKLHLAQQCESLELKLQLTEENEQSLNINLKGLQNQFDQLKEEHTKSKNELSTCQTQISGLQCLLEQKEQEKEDVRRKLTECLEEKKQEVVNLQDSCTHLQTSTCTLNEENKDLSSQLKAKEETIHLLTTKMESLHVKLKTTDEEKCLTNTELISVKDQLTTVEQELRDKTHDLQTQLKEQAELTEDMKLKNSVLTSDLESRNQSISSLQLEIANLTKEKEENAAIHQKDSQEYINEISKLQEQLKELSQELVLSHSNEEEVKKAMDAHAKEMGLTLERYKAENTYIVAQKDKEIESLREVQIKESEEREELKSKVLELEEQLQLHNQDKECVAKETEQYKAQIQALETQLNDKDNELTQLITAASTLQAKIKSPAIKEKNKATEISPFTTPIQSKATLLRTPSRQSKLQHNSTASTVSPRVPVTPQRITQRMTCTPQSNSKSKGKESLNEEKRQFKELFPDAGIEDDEAIFKKPKTKIATPRSSRGSTSGHGNTRVNRRVPSRGRGGKRKGGGVSHNIEKENENLSWFDLDPVFGFPPED